MNCIQSCGFLQKSAPLLGELPSSDLSFYSKKMILTDDSEVGLRKRNEKLHISIWSVKDRETFNDIY